MPVNLDDAFYPALWQLAKDTNLPPEYFLATLNMESGLDPAVPANPQYPDYHGLNQVMGSYLRVRGIDPQDYRTWPASRQLTEVVAPMLKENLRVSGKTIPIGPDGAAALHALNFLPGQVHSRGIAPDSVLAAKDAATLARLMPSAKFNASEPKWYAANSGLDYDKIGAITIREMARKLASKWPALKGVLQKLYAAGPAGYVPPPGLTDMPPQLAAPGVTSNATAVVLGGLVLGGFGWLWWMASRRRPA